MDETMKKYRLEAYGYEMVVSEDQSGKWWGGYRYDRGDIFIQVNSEGGDLEDTKLKVCRAVELVASVSGKSTMDACVESLPYWKEILN
jgi:hypothetical protein